jgi:hypothetical protein
MSKKNINTYIHKDLQPILQHIKNEIYFETHIPNRLIQITNIYKIKNTYHVECHFQGSKNQNDRLLQIIRDQLSQQTLLCSFLLKNFKSKKPFPVQMYYNEFINPIFLFNKRGFHLYDFLSLLSHEPTLSPSNLSFMSPSKIL